MSDQLEREFESDIRRLCALLGLKLYHTHDSRRSEPGWPDLAIVGTRLILRELKTSAGRVSVAQADWIAILAAADVDVAVWRPADWTSGRIAAELQAIKPDRREEPWRTAVAHYQERQAAKARQRLELQGARAVGKGHAQLRRLLVDPGCAP